MVLESPFYGARKPGYQFASQLLRVSDLLTLGRATIEESLCLLDWAGRHGFARLGDLLLLAPFPDCEKCCYSLVVTAKQAVHELWCHNLEVISG